MKGYKVVKRDMLHLGFKYQKGLNVDVNKLDNKDTGLHFFLDLNDLDKWLLWGDDLWEVETPVDAKVIHTFSTNTCRTDKLILLSKKPLASLDIWEHVPSTISARALAGAAARNNLELVELLISKQAPLKEYYDSPLDRYPLLYACHFGHLEIVNKLIEHGAIADERVFKAAEGKPEIVELLKDYLCYN